MQKALFIGTAVLSIFFNTGISATEIDNYKISEKDKYTIQEVAEKAMASVVFIAVEHDPYVKNYGAGSSKDVGLVRSFYDWFWPAEYFQGSGFFISPNGYIVTNAHVVSDHTQIKIFVQGEDRKLYDAKVVGIDYYSDIAVLKIENDNKEFPCLEFADSHQLKVGEPLLIIGNPTHSDFMGSVTAGIVSGLERNLGFDVIEGLIQTDAAVNGGNSGGPALNLQGKVIGVAVSSMRGRQNMSLLVPSYTADIVSRQLIKNKRLLQGFLGASFYSSVVNAYEVFYFDKYLGARVEEVIQNSPAYDAGFKQDDIIIELNGYPIVSVESLRNKLCILEPETKVQMKIYRNGMILEKTVELGKHELSKKYSTIVYKGYYQLVF